MKILLPLDGSLVSETTLGLAAAMARRLAAQLVVLRVTDPRAPLPAGAAGMAAALCQADQDGASEYLERIARDLTHRGVGGEVHWRQGHPVDQIVRVAREERVDLILMATHGRSGPARWMLGSVAEGVLRVAPCPVLLARGHLGEFEGFQRVIVPVQSTQASQEALREVQAYLHPQARLTLVRATDDLVRLSAVRSDEAAYQEYLGALEAELAELDPGGRCARQVVDAAPAEAILAVANEQEADLIAMSTHGRRGYNRLVVGSVTERVARHAPCSLLVFPARSKQRKSSRRS